MPAWFSRGFSGLGIKRYFHRKNKTPATLIRNHAPRQAFFCSPTLAM
jgi:hypothetical protein